MTSSANWPIWVLQIHPLLRASYIYYGPKMVIMGHSNPRRFGHQDPIGPNHAGPEIRHKKQMRRQLKRADRTAAGKGNGAVAAQIRARQLRSKLK